MHTITLDKRHFKAAEKKARQLGKTPTTYIELLIDAATLKFDDVLAPVRENFRRGQVTEDELDRAVADARKAIHARLKRSPRK